MAVLINKETGQSFEVADDEAPNAMRSMGLVQATPEQIDWLKKDQEYRAKPILDRAAETGEAAVVGLMKSGRELGKLRLDDSGLATSLFPEQAPQVSGAIQQHQAERDAILAAPRTAEIAERHPLAHTLGVDAPALFISPGVGGIAGMALESVGVGALEEAVGSTDEGRDFDIGNAATIAAQDLAFSGLAHAATQVASRVGNLLFFGTGNTMANNVKRGLDETAGPVVPDDVRFDGPLLEAETRTRRTAAASSPGMPPGPERDEMLRRAAPDLNDQVKTQGGDMFESTLDSAKKSASVADSDMVARRVDEMLPKTTPAQTSWSADATRKFDDTRNALDSVTDEAGAPYAQRARKVADDAIAAIDASADSSAWFRSASTAREQLDSLADEIASSGLPATHRASLIVDDARGFLGRTLTDRSLFGAAAEMHAGVHGVARDKIASAVRTAGGDLRSRLSEFVSADEATRATMRKPLEQAIEGFEELAQAHERFGTALPKTIEALRENAATLRRGLKLADDVQTAARSAPKQTAPRAAASAPKPSAARAETLADQIRQRAEKVAKQAGAGAAQRAVDYAAGPGRAVYDDAVSDVLKGAIQGAAAVAGLSVLGPPGLVIGWLGARSVGRKLAPELGKQILDAAQRYVKQHGADTAGAALLATAALGDEGEGDDSDTLAASVGGLFFARRFAERALGTVGRGAKAAGKGVMKASEAVTGAVDAATGKAAEVVGKATYTAGRKVGEAIGSGVDAVAKVAADEDLVKGAIKSGVRDPKRWLVRNTRGRIADKAADYFGPRISNAATQWLEKRHGKTAQEVVNEAVDETAEAARKDSALLEEHSAQSAAMVEDVGAQIRAALNETAEQKARALQAFPQRIGGDPHAQRQLLTSAVDELSSALGKVSDGSTAKVAIEFANAAKQAIINAPTAKDRFRIGMQLTETLVHHTAEAGDSEMAKVFGAYADKMWEAMGQREVWMGARELQREAKRAAKKRESIIAKISAGEKLGIAALVGSAAVDDEDTAAALAATGGMGALVGKGKLMKLAPDAAKLAESMSGAKPSGKLWASAADATSERTLADGLASKYNTAESYNEVLGALGTKLDIEQQRALKNWSGYSYKELQGNLAGETATKVRNALDAAVQSGLTVPGEVSRGVMLTADELNRLKASKEFESPAFMATSANRNYPKTFLANKADEAKAGKVPVVLQVHQTSGVPIPGDPREAEILLRPGTKFDVRVVRDEVRKGQFEEVVHLFEKTPDAVDPRQLGTIPPKGKAKRPDGPIAAKPERDATPTKFYPNSNQARNEYGENMRPYREAQRADNTRMAQLAKDYGLAGAGVGAAAMSDDENGAAIASAAGLLAGRKIMRLSGHKTMSEIAEAFGGEVPEHLHTMLKEAKVGTQLSPNGMNRLYDASKIGVTADGRPVVFDNKGYALGDARHRYQAELTAAEPPKPKKGQNREPLDFEKMDRESAEKIARVESVQREGGFGTRDHSGYDTIEVNEKALKSLATQTGKAIQKLEPEEQLALLDYIEGGGAATFRGLQQGAEGIAKKEQFAAALPDFESAVEKLQRPGLTESVGPLWRGFHLSPDDATRLVNSNYVETGSLTSTSFSPFHASDKFADTAAADAAGHVPVVLKFEHVERAAPISASGFSKQYGTGEREALLPKGAAFEVKNVTRTMSPSGGSIEVTLSEVPRASAKQVGFVLAGLLGLGALATSDDASASEPADEPEAQPEPDARTIAANRILAIDQAATQRIKHTARVLAGLADPPDPEGLTTHLARFGADYDDPRSAFEDRKEILRKADVSPALVYDVIGASMGDVASVSPELYQAAAARVLDNFRYLRENLPTEVKNSIVYPTGLPPSESAMRDWATQWSTTMDPESVFDDIDRGTVTHLQIETLQGAHPDIYQQMRTEILAEVGANFETVPTSTKMQLDILFGADGLAGPLFSSEAAAIIGAASQAAAQRKQPGPADTGGAEETAAGPSGLEAIRTSVTNRGV